MMYVSQIIMLYTLNLYSAVCQLHLNKTGRKKFLFKSTISEFCNLTGHWQQPETYLMKEEVAEIW